MNSISEFQGRAIPTFEMAENQLISLSFDLLSAELSF